MTITVCPECGSNHIERRSPGKGVGPSTTDHNWWCSTCEARFDEPHEREAHNAAISAAGQLRRLGIDPERVHSFQEGDA